MDIHGPHEITKSGQVSVPKDLRDEVRIGTKEQVYFALNPDQPGTLLLIPASRVESWLDRGRAADQPRLAKGKGGTNK